MIDTKTAKIDTLSFELLHTKQVRAAVLRLDVLHPVVSGNKWFKLKYHLECIGAEHEKTIITVGGAYSNHIIATAYAAKHYGLRSIGLIRGEKPPQLSPTLQHAVSLGMDIHFIPRTAYQQRHSVSFQEMVQETFGPGYYIPEGGASEPGVRGSEEIWDLVNEKNYSHVLAAMGTGTMVSGLLRRLPLSSRLIGVPVLKGVDWNFLTAQEPSEHSNLLEIISGFDFGGYAKRTPELLAFMNTWYMNTGIPSDFVYTAKLFFAFMTLLEQGKFNKGSDVLIIHSGGLQGNLSLPANSLLF